MSRANKKKIEAFIKKAQEATQQKGLDLSSSEDLSIGIMNLISIEEHLFFTSQKTGKKKYLDLLNEIRAIRTSLLKEIIKDYEGEVWCISKHLLAASMRVMEVGTKELKKGDKKKAWELFEKSYNLYSLFWGLNLNLINTDELSEKHTPKDDSLFARLGVLVKKAINCCKE